MAKVLDDDDDDGEEEFLLDPAPEPDQQMAIVTALEEEEESSHVYSVSKEWYGKWCLYVGLPESFERCNTRKTAPPPHIVPNPDVIVRSSQRNDAPSNECPSPSKTPSTECARTKPGPITMDLGSDEGNIYADEKIWKRWVRWYGVSANHELDRRNWASDDKDFEICVLSPYCGLIENPVKTFDISEECGYIEIQLRQIFRISRHRSTRLWVCEKARHARFQPMLFRQREISSYEFVDPAKNYILALEVANLDGTWPTYVPGTASGSFDAYRELIEGGPGMRSSLWESGLADTLETVYSGISNELKETAAGIVETVKCVTAIKETELDSVKQILREKMRKCEESQSTAEETTRELRKDEHLLKLERKKLEEERESFKEERHLFAEELVRMHTVNMIQESRVKLNIGGQVLVTSTFTLSKDPNSMLAAMFSGRHALKQDEDGSYFIDRDGTHFRYILNYLRDGNFRPGTLPTDRNVLSELLTEAEYFQIAGLVALLSETLNSKEGGDGGGNRGAGRGICPRGPANGGARRGRV